LSTKIFRYFFLSLSVFFHREFSDIIAWNICVDDKHSSYAGRPMDTVEHFSNYLRTIGAHNFLGIGIAIVLLWLLFSGLRKGLKERKNPDENEEEQ